MRILVFGSGGENRGSLSVLKSTIKMLEKEIRGANINVISHFPEIDSLQCEVSAFRYPAFRPGLYNRLKGILFLFQCSLLAILYRSSDFNENWLVNVDRLKLLQAYGKTDCIVFCGTDDISDTYGFLYSIDFIIKGVLIPTLMKKTVIIHASQIGPFKKSLSGTIFIFFLKLVLNQVNLITVRDQISLRKLREMSVNNPPIYLTADPAFLLRPSPIKKIKRIFVKEGIDINAKPLVGIIPSALIYRYTNGRTLEEKFVRYVLLMSKVIDFLIKRFDCTVVLVPHVFARNNDDRMVCKAIYWRVTSRRNLILITNPYTPEEFKGIIGQFDLLISSRMHPIIHAISMGTPIIGIDYTFKISELMRRIGQGNRVCKIKNLDYEELALKVDEVILNRQKIRETLGIRSKLMENYASRNAKLIGACLKRRKKGG